MLNSNMVLMQKNNMIKGVLEGTDDDNAVNFKQLNSYLNAAKILLQKRSYYEELFEHYFDLVNPNQLI